MRNKAVFFDRDGVLNEAIVKNGKPYPPSTLDQLVIPTDVGPALQLLKDAGFILLGATNQPDVARSTTPKNLVEAINQKLLNELPLREIFTCFHDDNHNCDCRKPLPGLLQQGAKKYDVDLTQSYMIGDRWKDIEAGKRAGCKTIWLNKNYQETIPQQPHFIATNLLAAAKWIKSGEAK